MPEQFLQALHGDRSSTEGGDRISHRALIMYFRITARESAYAGLFVQNWKTHMSSWWSAA
jgi:hypothetical protein